MLQPQPGERGSVTGAVDTAGTEGEQKLRSVGGRVQASWRQGPPQTGHCVRGCHSSSPEKSKLLRSVHIPSSCQAAKKLRGVMPREKKHFNLPPLSLRGRERGKKSFLGALSPCLNSVREGVGLPSFSFLQGENKRNSNPTLK